MARHFDGEDAVIGGAAATEKGQELARQAGLQDTVRSASLQHGTAEFTGKGAVSQLEEVSP